MNKDELLDIPNNWTCSRLGDILNSVKGKKPKKLGQKDDDKYIPYIDIKAFEKNIFRYYTDGNACVLCEPNDVLIVWDGARFGLVGTNCKGAIGSTLVKLKHYKLNSKYLYYYLRTKYEYINAHPRGAGIPHVEPSIFWNLLFPLPPLEEQQRIVNKIEQLLTELDAGIKSLKYAKGQLQEYRQSVLKSAFEGKLVTTEDELAKTENRDYESGEKLLERILKEKEDKSSNSKQSKTKGSQKIDTSDLPELPEGWSWVSLKNIAEINPKLPSDYSEDMDVSFLPMKAIEEKTGYYDLSSIKKYGQVKKGSYRSFKDGDILFAKITPCMENGKIAVVNNLINGIGFGSTEYHVIRLLDHQLPRKYLFYYLIQDNFRKNAKRHMTGSAGQLRVPVNYMKDVFIPLPPLAEQQRIAEEIERCLSVADETEKTIDNSLDQAENLRQSILKKAFEGRLVPQNPDDEPASVLLERIKEEKEKQESKSKSKSKTGTSKSKNAKLKV